MTLTDMSETKGVFQYGPRLAKTKNPRMGCCGSTHGSMHLSTCVERLKKAKTDPMKAKVQELKQRGFLSQEVAHELKMRLGDVNKLWL